MNLSLSQRERLMSLSTYLVSSSHPHLLVLLSLLLLFPLIIFGSPTEKTNKQTKKQKTKVLSYNSKKNECVAMINQNKQKKKQKRERENRYQR
jgi:hypothetical protein